MKLTSMKYADGISKSKQIKFAGLNHRLGAKDGEVWDMRNMTSDHYPLLASRKKRWRLKTFEAAGGIYAWDGLCWVEGTGFYFGGEKKGEVTAGQKTFASLGHWIVILPDKRCYNVTTGEFREMESRWSGDSLTFSDGLLYGEEAEANTILREGVEWSEYFSTGDAVTISGCTAQPGNNKTVIIRAIDGDKLTFYEHTFSLGDEDTGSYTENGEIKVERTVPELKYLCENENRLWGCSDTTIYACKQGDIFNWNVYDGLADDAWAVDPGSPGRFTGCISYKGYPTFFKEDRIYKVYGSLPSNFQVMGSATLGLMEGCAASLAIAGETLFYLGRNGIMAYTGGIPQPISEDLGLQPFRSAVAGSDGLKYYVSMEKEDGCCGLYVYDSQRGMWHKEDETRATHFAKHLGNLCFLNEAGELWRIGDTLQIPEDAVAEGTVEWMVEFADFTQEDPNRKGVGKLQLRLEIDEGARVQVWIQFDSDGRWHPVGGILRSDKKGSCYLPIVPRRCDHYRVKITGTGGCRIYSLVRESYSGSEMKSTYGRN